MSIIHGRKRIVAPPSGSLALAYRDAGSKRSYKSNSALGQLMGGNTLVFRCRFDSFVNAVDGVNSSDNLISWNADTPPGGNNSMIWLVGPRGRSGLSGIKMGLTTRVEGVGTLVLGFLGSTSLSTGTDYVVGIKSVLGYGYKMWINGSLESETFWTGSNTHQWWGNCFSSADQSAPTNNFGIGAGLSGTSGGLTWGSGSNADIDEFAVWNIAQSDADMATLTTIGTDIPGSFGSNLVCYHDFDNDTATVGTDDGSYAENLTHENVVLGDFIAYP